MASEAGNNCPSSFMGSPTKSVRLLKNVLHPQKINRNSLLSILLGVFGLFSVWCRRTSEASKISVAGVGQSFSAPSQWKSSVFRTRVPAVDFQLPPLSASWT